MTALIEVDDTTAVLLGQWADHAPEWHDARRGRIGGSSVAAVCGLSKWQSPFSLWCEMNDMVQPDPQNDEQARGHFLEPGIADWFAWKHPELEVRHGGTYVHRDRDYQLCNPDRLLYQGGRLVGGLECKTDVRAQQSGWGRAGTDEIPIYYRVQVIWYMDVFGFDRWHVALLDGNLSFREYVVPYDAALAAELRDAAEDFLASLYWGEAPELDDHEATYATIRKLHPEIEEKAVVEVEQDLAIEFTEAHEGLQAAKKRWDKARSLMGDRMGRAQRAYFNGWHVANRASKGGGKPYVEASRTIPDSSRLRQEDAA